MIRTGILYVAGSFDGVVMPSASMYSLFFFFFDLFSFFSRFSFLLFRRVDCKQIIMFALTGIGNLTITMPLQKRQDTERHVN